MRRYQIYKFVIVGADFHCEGGAWKSIYRFFRSREEFGDQCLLVDLRRGDGLRQWIASILFSRRLIVNGMAAVERWSVLIPLLFRKDVAIYLHDTDHALNEFQRHHPLKYRLLGRVLRRNPVLCVSQQMALYYRAQFGTVRSMVVYEVIETNPRPRLAAGVIHIMMVGSLNRRKGFPLFVEVAQLAERSGLPWQFHWVGALGESGLGKLPPQVKWWGWRESASSLLEQADLLFLSSIDDPQPLVCLEAMALGKRAVVYKLTGSAELVAGQSGCRVLQEYNADAAMQAIRDALSEQPSVEALGDVLARHNSIDAFSDALVRVFGGGVPGAKPNA